MDGLKHPVGEQPANIYWRRRLFLIIAIVVLALFLWWAISALTSSKGTPTHSPSGASSPETTVSTSPTSTAAADPGRTCTGDDYTVATAIAADVPASKKAPFTVTVTSTADSPCIIDPTADSKLTVRSGNDQWFDSSDCPSSFALFDAEAFLIEAGKSHDLKTTWNYGRDDKGCVDKLQTAKAGTYKATITVAGVKGDEVTFRVG
jgi:hypothetical protein